MNNSDFLSKNSDEILNLQFSIDLLLKEDPETDLMGRKLQAKLIMAQAEELLKQLYEYQEQNHQEKDIHIKQNIVAQNVILLNNQIKILTDFINCLDANSEIRKKVLTEIASAENKIIKSKFARKK